MFSIGEQLYRLTGRDEETLLVEQFFKTFVASAVGASQVALIVENIPIDRCLFIKQVIFTGNGYAGGNWIRTLVQLDARFVGGLITVCKRESFSVGLVSDGSNNVVTSGASVVQTYDVDTLYPPGMQSIRLEAQTPAKAVTADCIFEVSGFLLPPGRIGRR